MISTKYKGRVTGLYGWSDKLQSNYGNFESFASFDENYGIAKRLGYRSAKQAWDDNPVMAGTVDPRDLANLTHDYCKGERDQDDLPELYVLDSAPTDGKLF